MGGFFLVWRRLGLSGKEFSIEKKKTTSTYDWQGNQGGKI